ncbi:hemerythrin domain-containing protein [Knoellia sp. CPCC 206450]|uniref:hemerythrin domain-containing protein n=1 Tax=Knoellia tibetensis TaxID=3404798 RepID=UPI003B439EC7
MTSIADQGLAQLGGPLSVLSRQKRDHVRLDRLLDDLADSPTGHAQRQALRRLARVVFPHAFAEESVLWPFLRRVVPDGQALTLRVEQEHQEVNELWASLERLTPDDDRRRPLLERLAEVLRSDVRDEEDVLLPVLQQGRSRTQLRALGVAWEVVRRLSPTRPHVLVSRRPPGNVVAALPLTLTDRARDRLDSIAESSPRLEAPAAQLSRGAARLARLVERRKPSRAGEHRSTRRALEPDLALSTTSIGEER